MVHQQTIMELKFQRGKGRQSSERRAGGTIELGGENFEDRDLVELIFDSPSSGLYKSLNNACQMIKQVIFGLLILIFFS